MEGVYYLINGKKPNVSVAVHMLAISLVEIVTIL